MDANYKWSPLKDPSLPGSFFHVVASVGCVATNSSVAAGNY